MCNVMNNISGNSQIIKPVLSTTEQNKIMNSLNTTAVKLSMGALNGVTKAHTNAKFHLVLEYKPIQIQPYNTKKNIYALLFKLVPTVTKSKKVRQTKLIVKQEKRKV